MVLDLQINTGRKRISLFHKFLYFSLLVWLGFAGRLWAQPEAFNHPEVVWKTLETEHFVVNYHQGTERTANLVAKIAEEIYPHITGLYQYEPPAKTQFIIRDTDDYSNGGAYFYDNKVEIWAENLDYILRGTHNWLRDVVTHEFTHIVSLQKALKFGIHVPAGWFQVFAYEKERRKDVVRGFPNVLVSYPISGINIPVWFAEGTAQFQSPDKRFDYRDSHREMILRDRVVTHNLLDLNQMSVFGKNSIGNESSYNQGFAFVRYLARTFGDSVVRDLAATAASWKNLNFKQVIRKVTGRDAEQIFRDWKTYLEETYSTRLKTVRQHLKIGEPFVEEGIGNIHPVFSPDGQKLAYLKAQGDYLSMNVLVVADLKTGKKRSLAGPVSSSISWSPDGRYLVYARHTKLQPNGSSYNDIFIFDTKRGREFQLTKALRATNPDWSHDGTRIAFVVHSDGLTNLFVLTLVELELLKQKQYWHTAYYDLNAHRLVDRIPGERKKHWKQYYRKVRYWGKAIHQLTHFTDGRQIYHPRWAPDDSYLVFDTSIKFARDIARISASGGKMEFILHARYDERYPSFDPRTGELYFACDKTGIFNIYSLNLTTGEIQPHTNVVGGAFMPTVNQEGTLFYSLYRNQGYKIYRIPHVNAVPEEYLDYDTNYEAKIPEIEADDRVVHPLPSRPYKRTYGPVGIMPRLVIDYGTIKPGFYVYTNEILDKLFFLGGADMNLDMEYNLFALFELRLWKPTVFVDFYKQSAKLTDSFYDPYGFYRSSDRIKITFDLMQADLGLRGKYKNSFEWKLAYTYSLYRANIGTFAYKELSTNRLFVSPPIRYSYLRGHSLSLALKRSRIYPEVDRAINPRKGYYLFVKFTHDWNKFLSDFSTDRVVGMEEYNKYNYNKLELDFEQYIPVPFTRHHALALRLQSGFIDKPVDDFFNFFAGGLVGLKGYSYYSIEGRAMSIGTVTYRFPLVRNLNWQIVNWYLDKIYLGAFYQYGDAWDPDHFALRNFKSDVGIQVRLETFSWYMFPTRIFFEAAYPLVENYHHSIEYKQEWKFYLGILFDFDLRFEKKLRYGR